MTNRVNWIPYFVLTKGWGTGSFERYFKKAATRNVTGFMRRVSVVGNSIA
jgi:hypothetical protein